MLSKLIWLVIQQPKKMLHILVSDYITGICGLPPTTLPTLLPTKKTHLYDTMIEMHTHMNINYIYDEYNSWLDFELNLTLNQKESLRGWVIFIYLKKTYKIIQI